MPTINGIKMACAPCIRGHRSTKCNHADERLMVPVRKPGRPLSTCPHPQHEACGCGSVTAAIPRKQQCGCGSSSHAAGHNGHSKDIVANPAQIQSKLPPLAVESDAPKISAGPPPTMKATANFKVPKPSRPQSNSRKQSYDSGPVEGSDDVKMNTFDMKKAYIRPQPLAPTPEQTKNTNGVGSMPWQPPDPTLNGFIGKPSVGHLDFNGIARIVNGNVHIMNRDPTTPPIDAENKYGQFATLSPPQQFPGYTRQLHQQQNGVIIETRIHNVGPNGATNVNGQWVANYKEQIVMPAVQKQETQPNPTNGAQGSCCSSKRRRAPSPVPEKASAGGSCCSSKRSKSISHSATQPRPLQPTPSQSPHLTPLNNQPNHVTGNFSTVGFAGHPGGFEYMQQAGLNGMAYPTVFAYPPAYGSYQHPLEPAQWKQGVQYNTYAHMMATNPRLPLGVVRGNEMDTLHACGCGDGCECIGCAAHPYNSATQDYVRSAWEMGREQIVNHRASQSNGSLSENYPASATVPNPNGSNPNIQISNGSDPPVSPTGGTPSDTSGDDVPLSASDFFFVNYPFANDGCGGDTLSCPCGDDCACLGCFIHNNPDALELAVENGNAENSEVVAGSTKDEHATPVAKPKGSCCGGSGSPEKTEEINPNADSGFAGTTMVSNYGEFCGDDEGTFPCPPDGCQCIGCTIHSRA